MLNAITTRTSTPHEDDELWPGGSARPVLDYLTATLGMTMPACRMDHCTSPEQSKTSGPEPPQT